MNVYTINDLKHICELAVLKGLGEKKILISDDDEGNGYHLLMFGFTSVKDIGGEFISIDDILPKGEDKKDYIILG